MAKIKYLKGDVKPSQEGDGESDSVINANATAEEILKMCDNSDGSNELLGRFGIPEERDEARSYISNKVIIPDASYGNGKNSENEFDPDLDGIIFDKVKEMLLADIKDDASKPDVTARTETA